MHQQTELLTFFRTRPQENPAKDGHSSAIVAQLPAEIVANTHLADSHTNLAHEPFIKTHITGAQQMQHNLTTTSWACLAGSLLFVLVQLGWQWAHGGIEAHHLFADPKQPALSNAWGLLLMPLLGAGTAWRLRRSSQVRPVLLALAGSLMYGALLSVLFLSGLESLLLPALGVLFVLALWLPLYRAEYVLGFVAGFSLAIGNVLPLLPATPIVLLALLALGLKTLWRRQRAAA